MTGTAPGAPPSPRTQLKEGLKKALLNAGNWISKVTELLDFTDDESMAFALRRDKDHEAYVEIIRSLNEMVDYVKADLQDSMDTIEVIQQVLEKHGLPRFVNQFILNMANADDN